ncbi:MAG TPA: dihydrofolate reductase family protein [Candidatus Limnocylindrales bacterium]|nr:dihydrofolate reductase family protein [Candidatus Limnocylindrales bacterium]
MTAAVGAREVNVAAPKIETLFDRAQARDRPLRGAGMPPVLEERYGGPLLVPVGTGRPTVLANFVSTLDGVVALGSGDLTGGGLISGFHEPDRFVMALLRGIADVVVVGAGTLRGSTRHRWVADHVQPKLADAFADWRSAMGLARHPTTIVVTASGDIPVEHAGLNDAAIPVVVATTASGARRLFATRIAPHVSVAASETDGPLRGSDIVAVAQAAGARVILCEGGPHLLAQLVEQDLLDELFLTVAPQLVGRGGPQRIGLVEGLALPPRDARWHDLASVRRSDNHLFLRYRRTGVDEQEPRND